MLMESKRVTIDHDEIEKWVGSEGGKPAVLRGRKGEAGTLRIIFPEAEEEELLEEISWDDFFKKFEEEHLALAFRESSDPLGIWWRFLNRDELDTESEEERETGGGIENEREWLIEDEEDQY